MQDYRPIRDALYEDYRQMLPRNPAHSPLKWRLIVVAKTLALPRVRAVTYYRFSQLCIRHGLLPVAAMFHSRAIRCSGAEIHPYADIKPGMSIWHSNGIVIGRQARVGRNLIIMQGVTLGSRLDDGLLIVGDNCFVGAGAVVLGPITIGNNVIIGANATVTRSVPDDVTIAGSPARVINKK